LGSTPHAKNRPELRLPAQKLNRHTKLARLPHDRVRLSGGDRFDNRWPGEVDPEAAKSVDVVLAEDLLHRLHCARIREGARADETTGESPRRVDDVVIVGSVPGGLDQERGRNSRASHLPEEDLGARVVLERLFLSRDLRIAQPGGGPDVRAGVDDHRVGHRRSYPFTPLTTTP
jgi:hypothetical protein